MSYFEQKTNNIDGLENVFNNFINSDSLEGEDGEDKAFFSTDVIDDLIDNIEGEDENENFDGEDEQYDENEYLNDIDFSEFKGSNFSSNLRKVNKQATIQKRLKAKPKTKVKPKPLPTITKSKEGVVSMQNIDSFILKESKIKNIGYYKGEKLKELAIHIVNDSALDFTVELFNPSTPLDYLYSTGLNLNDKITIAGGDNIVTYTDVLFNLLANPVMIPNAKLAFAGAKYMEQRNEPLLFKNKQIEGSQVSYPSLLLLQIDTYQKANDLISFDIFQSLGKPFFPSGMDIVQYKVLAGNSVTIVFFYKQKDIRKIFYEEAKILPRHNLNSLIK